MDLHSVKAVALSRLDLIRAWLPSEILCTAGGGRSCWAPGAAAMEWNGGSDVCKTDARNTGRRGTLFGV